MVVLRFKKMGRAHQPFYRLCAMDQRAPRDGRPIEELGWYDPVAVEGKQHAIKGERVRYWLGVGAQPSRTVMNLLRTLSIDNTVGTKGRKPIAARRVRAPAAG